MAPKRTARFALDSAAGLAIAEPLTAPEPNPLFDNSAVDGYAVGSAADGAKGMRLRIQDSVAAGAVSPGSVAKGCAMRILTGAPTPPNTFGIAMQEDVRRHYDEIVLVLPVEEGRHVRRIGAEFPAGACLAVAGTPIDAGVVAQLAFAGVVKPLVYDAPKVAILSTGDELIDPAETPTGSQVRDSNSAMLSVQVRQACPASLTRRQLADRRDSVLRALAFAAAKNDLVIVSGGASVGDRDFIGSVVAEIGSVIFHGVAIRPGKPLLFGAVGSALVFGLPGNPASAFVCFELFVKEALRRLAGWSEPESRWDDVPSGFDHAPCGREDFVRVRRTAAGFVPAGDQASFGILSLGQAHALARFPADREVRIGETCQVTWLR